MKIITHSGNFHPDEIFAVATVKRWLKTHDVVICRTRDEKMMAKKEPEDFVLDVGFVYEPAERRFDHHQPGTAGARDNGIPYATFGLVWKEYGPTICAAGNSSLNKDEEGKEMALRIDTKLVCSIDAPDNGVDVFTRVSQDLKPYTLEQALSSFIPTWQEKDIDMDDAFKRALLFAEEILDREIIKARGFVDGKRLVEKAYEEAEDKRIIVLQNNYPWKDVIQALPEPLFVVMNNGIQTTWAVSAIGEGSGTFNSRKLFPKSWAGKTGSELAAVTGVKDANFCHNGRFIAIANSKEGALQLAKLAVDA